MAKETHPKVHKYDIPLAGCFFTRNYHPDGSWSRMVYRDGQPLAGSQTKAANTAAGVRWFTLIGYQRIADGSQGAEVVKSPVNLQYGPFETSAEADACMDLFGAGVVAVLTTFGEELKPLHMVEHKGAPLKGAAPGNVDDMTGPLQPVAPKEPGQ